MEVLIFSDSHGRVTGMKQALERQLRKPDVLIHLGDGARDLDALDPDGIDVYSVRGNCDLFGSTLYGIPPEESVTALGGHTLFLAHGHRYGVKSGYGGILTAAVSRGADIVLFGHTHREYEEVIPAGSVIGGITLARPLYLFNPGSIGTYNENGEKTFGLLTIRDGAVLFSHGKILHE